MKSRGGRGRICSMFAGLFAAIVDRKVAICSGFCIVGGVL